MELHTTKSFCKAPAFGGTAWWLGGGEGQGHQHRVPPRQPVLPSTGGHAPLVRIETWRLVREWSLPALIPDDADRGFPTKGRSPALGRAGGERLSSVGAGWRDRPHLCSQCLSWQLPCQPSDWSFRVIEGESQTLEETLVTALKLAYSRGSHAAPGAGWEREGKQSKGNPGFLFLPFYVIGFCSVSDCKSGTEP